jgi:hypothetical protein
MPADEIALRAQNLVSRKHVLLVTEHRMRVGAC